MKTNNIAMKQILMEAEKEINKFYNSKNFLAAIITGEEKELSFDLYSKEDLKTQKLKSIQLVKEYKPLWLIYEEENNIYIFLKNSNGNIKNITLEDIPHCINYSRI